MELELAVSLRCLYKQLRGLWGLALFAGQLLHSQAQLSSPMFYNLAHITVNLSSKSHSEGPITHATFAGSGIMRTELSNLAGLQLNYARNSDATLTDISPYTMPLLS